MDELTSRSLTTVRKEIREMSSAELDRYFKALWEYKNHGRRDDRPYFRNYYALVAHHAKATANSTVRFASIVIYSNELERLIYNVDIHIASTCKHLFL